MGPPSFQGEDRWCLPPNLARGVIVLRSPRQSVAAAAVVVVDVVAASALVGGIGGHVRKRGGPRAHQTLNIELQRNHVRSTRTNYFKLKVNPQLLMKQQIADYELLRYNSLMVSWVVYQDNSTKDGSVGCH